MPSLSEATAKFGFSIFKEFKQNAGGNMVFSPLGIEAELAMTLLGVRDKTAFQMQKVLHLDEVTTGDRPTVGDSHGISAALYGTPGEIHSQFHSLLAEINKPNDDYLLTIASRLYGSQTFQFLQSYLDGIKDIYNAGLETVDFLHASEDSRGKINSWVENQTNGKIKELFSAGTIDPATVLVLANAIYFKGNWAVKFKQENTQEINFRTNKDTSRPVQMMKQTGFFNMGYIEESQGKILELPYTNKHLSMFVLLPSDSSSLEKLEQDLTFEKLLELMNPENMARKEVNLHFPRFRIEETYSLRPTLEAMGVTDIFDAESADFSGMTTQRGLAVSKIIHKSYVEVNEEGTEAAAATGVVVGYNSSRKEEFNCDHPFLFLIRHNKSNSILFYGRVAAP
ncbi:serpin B4-like [Phascolarctos cinereus]|uniref:Serpin B4-like n=1 Tax=Phascolarctos cinereus TaxID=38626 RepID=A0A6P5L3L1_PHACI|nr:serpin B4-like [Phascolarctos cinereus]